MFIKICGITSVADARMVAGTGVQAIGLNFFPESPRFVQPATALEIIQNLPPFVESVGVFVNTQPAEIRAVANAVGLRTIQVHGDKSPKMVAELREFSVIPAFSLGNESDAAAAIAFLAECNTLGRLPTAILIDASVAGKFGGTGTTVSWQLAQSVVARSNVPVTLAGGLTAKNVGEAIREVRPWGVDVASGVEVAPGRKESHKVRTFVEAVHRATSRQSKPSTK